MLFSLDTEDGGTLWRSDGFSNRGISDVLIGNGKLSTGVFLLVSVYLCQFVFFAILGLGWTWGSFDRSSAVVFGSTIDPVVTLGSKRLQLKAGKALVVRYYASIEVGNIDMWLSRSWPGGTVYSQHGKIHQTGKGELKLIAPTDGWYRLVVTASSPDYKHRPKDHDPANWAKYQKRYKSSYSLSWRAEP